MIKAALNSLFYLVLAVVFRLTFRTSELGTRKKARKRDISYHTMSEKETTCLDAFMTITQTAIQLNVDVFQYIKQIISGNQNRITLASIILQKNKNTSAF